MPNVVLPQPKAARPFRSTNLVIYSNHRGLPRLKGSRIAYDSEGTGLIPYGPPEFWTCRHCGQHFYPARPFAFSFCDDNGNTEYFRWAVDPYTRRVIPGPIREQEAIRDLLENEHVLLFGHNISYDLRIISFFNRIVRRVRAKVIDTMILAHIATAGDELTYGLKPLARRYSGYPDTDEKQLEAEVNQARRVAKAKGWLIAGGKKEVDRGDHVIYAGNKPVKADYWLVPNPQTLTKTDHSLVREYAIGDAIRAMLLGNLWYDEVMRDTGLRDTLIREHHLFWELRRMENCGTRVFPEHIDHLIDWYKGSIKRWEKVAFTNGGWKWEKLTAAQIRRGVQPKKVLMNFRSPKQLTAKFYDELKFPKQYKERTPSLKRYQEWEEDIARRLDDGEDVSNVPGPNMSLTLGKDQLAEWGEVDEETGEPQSWLAKSILEIRSCYKSISDLHIYQQFMYPEDYPVNKVWVLHPNYNQAVAVTGRLTCNDPNLQQVTSATTGLRKSDIQGRQRECFGPRPDCVWIMPDYSQIEVWVFAFQSGEKQMQEALLSGRDFHDSIAEISFGHLPDFEHRKGYYRKQAKLIMFGKLYGGGIGTPEKPSRLIKNLRMPYEQGVEFVKKFDDDFEAVKQYMKRRTSEVKRMKEARNVFGRKYVFENDWAYKIVNYLVQGTSAEILKMATLRVGWMLRHRWRHPLLGLLNTIHDELIIECPRELLCKRLLREIIYVMQMDSKFVGIPVPLPVAVKITADIRKSNGGEIFGRWNKTRDIYKAKYEPDKPDLRWLTGGVPRSNNDPRFGDLPAFMRRCPYRARSHSRFVIPAA